MSFGDRVGPRRPRAVPTKTRRNLGPALRPARKWAGLWTSNLRIGLLGGSFNPAHQGHVHISRQAALALGLDAVWWLVTPGNPLKDRTNYAPLAERLEAARAVADSRLITVTAIENDLKTRYTIDTLSQLKRRMPRTQFFWLMGADNLSGIVAWRQWSRIFHLSPIAVVGRPTYSLKALNSKASIRFKSSRRNSSALRAVGQKIRAPLWTFIFCRLHDASSSEIRRNAAGLH